MADYLIPNLRNACRVLKYLSTVDKKTGIADLARELAIPRTTVLRIVRTFEAENFLREDETGLHLGGALASISASATTQKDLRFAAKPHLQALMQATDETSQLAIWDAARVLIVAVANCSHPLSAASKQGTRAHVHTSATGKVLLAHGVGGPLAQAWPKAMRLKMTDQSLTTLAEMKQESALVVARGYALDNEEYHHGVRCLAAPVRDSSGAVCAAVDDGDRVRAGGDGHH